MNGNGEEDEALRGMDVDVVVAWWLDACLQGRMTAELLLGALHSLDADSRFTPSDFSHRMAALQDEVRSVLTGEHTDLARVERAAVEFLGAHPDRVLEAAPAPDWYLQ